MGAGDAEGPHGKSAIVLAQTTELGGMEPLSDMYVHVESLGSEPPGPAGAVAP